jgi:hypothetical protein
MTGNSVSAVGSLKDDHISVARQNLKIGQCFAALRRFEERVSGAPGVDILTCWVLTAKRKGIVASGQIVIRFTGDVGAYEIGRWTVWRHGRADVSLGSLVLVDEPADVVDRGLTVAWRSGVVTQAIRFARQTKPL